MNKGTEIFKYLRESLIDWKPKTSDPTVSGKGFSRHNVVDIELGALPDVAEFDFVFVAPAIINARGVTTGTRNNKTSTQTIVIDIYSKRAGIGVEMKKKTLRAMNENIEFISNLFIQQGFIVSMPIMDLDYSGNGTIRQVMNITKTFITK